MRKETDTAFLQRLNEENQKRQNLRQEILSLQAKMKVDGVVNPRPFVMEIDGDAVSVGCDEEKGVFVWEAGGRIHSNRYSPDERVGEGTDEPTFYLVSKLFGFHSRYPAGAWYRMRKAGLTTSPKSELTSFTAEE